MRPADRMSTNIQLLDRKGSNGPLVTDPSPISERFIQRPEPIHQRNSTNQCSEDLENATSDRPNAKRLKYIRPFKMRFNKRSQITDGRDKDLVKVTLENHPKGYPRTAAYIDSDVDTALFRRFGILHARALLYMEVELTELEARLAKLDEDDTAKEETEWKLVNSVHHKNGRKNDDRKALVDEFTEKLVAYDELLLRDRQLRSLPRPSERVHRNFMDYICNERPFIKADRQFVFHQHDFVALEDFEESWLDVIMHRFISHCAKGPLKNIFVSKADREKTKDPHHRYYSEDRLGVFIKIIVAVGSTALLLLPIYIFLTRNMSPKAMASIILGFAFMLATAVSVFTGAKRHEVFAATAAYCAVLVTFLGNLLQQQPPQHQLQAQP